MGSLIETVSEVTILGERDKRQNKTKQNIREGKLTGRKHSQAEQKASVLNG